jgi:purine-binding chemotaxis protein CheW
VVLAADEVLGVQDYAEATVTAAAEILPGLEGIDGVLRCDDGMILIHNLDKFLSLDEEQVLELALRTQGAAP